MRAGTLQDLLKAGDRVAVSNITGREAGDVTVASQKYCANVVGGWALGKGGQAIDVPGAPAIPVFAGAGELFAKLPPPKRPNKVVVYSPPLAVYGEVKEIVDHAKGGVETMFIVTEHVSIEVTAKIARLCADANIDVLGGNSLGMINVLDGVRVGAVGGDSPAESFRAGCVAILSNSGNMVNTMASYLQSAGMGISYGISTGKDVLILLPVGDLLELAASDERTKMLVLYVEPGGLYEKRAVEMLTRTKFSKPLIVYVTGQILATRDLSLGHAGAVVEGGQTSAQAKMALFDEYFGLPPFDPETRYRKSPKLTKGLRRGLRITTLHHLPAAAKLIGDMLGIERDFPPAEPLHLNPWFADYRDLARRLPSRVILPAGAIPEPYASYARVATGERLGATPVRRNMRNASHASSNDGRITRIHGYSLEDQMAQGSFVRSVLLAWTGEPVTQTEEELLARCFIAAISNGPGTISAQGVKLSTSAGNEPNTAIIAALACIGDVHGGNGRQAVDYLLKVFRDIDIADPYDRKHGIDLDDLVHRVVDRFAQERDAAKDAGRDYDRIPCLGHPIFKDDAVNFDPRERVVSRFLEERGLYNIFLDFYHRLTLRLKEVGIARNVWAVNIDGAIASVVLAMCWRALREKRITIQRVRSIAFLAFALGRAAGAGGEFLDHQDFGSPMDMRVAVADCEVLTRPKD